LFLEAQESQEVSIEEPPRGQARGGGAPAREGGEEGARRRLASSKVLSRVTFCCTSTRAVTF
jgi:hypothetical protein